MMADVFARAKRPSRPKLLRIAHAKRQLRMDQGAGACTQEGSATVMLGRPVGDPVPLLGVSKTWGRLLADLWLVGTGPVVFTSLRLAFACSGTVRYVTPAPVVRHQPAP